MLAQERTRRSNTGGLVLIVGCAIVAAYAAVALSGTKTGAVLGLVTTVGPALLYGAIVAPMVFPFSAYAVLTPFDSILDMNEFGTLTRLLGAASAAALLFYMLRTKKAAEPPRSTALWLIFYLWTAASMFWAIDVASAQDLLPTSLQLFGLYIVAAMMRIDIKKLQIFTGAVALGGVTSAAYGLYMYHTGAGIFKNRLFIHTDTSKMNPDHFAESLVLPVAICLIAALWSRSLLTKVLAVAGTVIMLATIGLTGARGPMLGIAALLVYLIWRDPHRKALAIGSSALVALAVVITGPAYFFARWAEAGVNGGAGRVDIWRVGLIAFKQNWLVGAGYGNFPFAYDRAFMQTFQAFYANWHRASHNILLDAGVELGVIGLILLVLAWWGQFRLLKNIPAADIRFPLKLALEGSLIALFICGMFSDIMIEKFLWLAFMLVVLTRNAVVPPPPALEAVPENA
ncbi:MAG TPA: O-antigen ligase family protein [Candidatus Baltobacteraceae bacterium]|nr:O-antigen ligase family protein [Candidatus Baltobacteraceae bacterium]